MTALIFATGTFADTDLAKRARAEIDQGTVGIGADLALDSQQWEGVRLVFTTARLMGATAGIVPAWPQSQLWLTPKGWASVVVVEGVESVDSRFLNVGGLTWTDPANLPLLWSPDDDPHTGPECIGRFVSIERFVREGS